VRGRWTLARYRAFNPRGVVIAENGDLQHAGAHS
jgi:hypothetical protein